VVAMDRKEKEKDKDIWRRYMNNKIVFFVQLEVNFFFRTRYHTIKYRIYFFIDTTIPYNLAVHLDGNVGNVY
jgi:hypothetical protein